MKGVLPIRWRHVRWVLLAAALPVVWACNSPPLAKPNPVPERVVNKVFEAAANRDVDILFMIDNSPSMAPLQAKLAANFRLFMDTLSTAIVPGGGLPNVHIAVVSSDMGAGPQSPTPLCKMGGDQGNFQSAPRANGGNCTTGLKAGATFLSSIAGEPQLFSGNIADDFACLAQLGDQGCGFEHQFASMLAALEPGNANNAGFLRPNAYLSIIMITNEDDCSAPPDSPIFDSMSRTVMDKYGALASFRCNEFGHLCGGNAPPRSPAMLTDCVSNDNGPLLKVSDVIERTKKLKGGDASKILAAAIMGLPDDPQPTGVAHEEIFIPPNTPESIKAGYVPPDVPAVRHSCVNPDDNTYADPAIRINTWVKAFGGERRSICDKTFADALKGIANAIGKALQPQCVEGKLVDTDGNTKDGMVTPECIVADLSKDAAGKVTEIPVPSCKAKPGTLPCWEALHDDQKCVPEAGKTKTYLKINRKDGDVAQVSSSVACSVCIPGRDDPGCNY